MSESLNFAIVGSLIGRLEWFVFCGPDLSVDIGFCGSASDSSENISFCGSENIGIIRLIMSTSQQSYVLTINNCRYHIN